MEDRNGGVSVTAVLSSTLDWSAFSAAYFPGRRRHDFEALTAYGSYRRLRRVLGADRVEPAQGDAEDSFAMGVWGNEGGQGG
jgi:hypothetical protein